MRQPWLPFLWLGLTTLACGGSRGESPTGSAFAEQAGGASGQTGSGSALVTGAGGQNVAPGAGGDSSGAQGGTTSIAGTAGGGGSAGTVGTAGANGSGGAAPTTPPNLSHTFESISLEPGDELTGTCQSWTLNNDTPLYVNRVESTNLGNFHHSNWIWVADTLYTGPDGTWKCADRNFDQVAAGAFGGVFFAQSTQSRADTQAFPPGAAFEVPAHARIVGDVHLMNLTTSAATTSLHLDVYTLPEADAKVRLQPMAYTNLALDIAPATKTTAHMQCAAPQPDFNVYYILPHFHVLGQGMRIDVAGGPADGTMLFQSAASYGESQGKTFDPPLSIKGATGLGITCDYDNPRAASVHYGMGDQEMCVALLYADGKKTGGEAISNLSVADTGGVHTTDSLCVSVGTP